MAIEKCKGVGEVELANIPRVKNPGAGRCFQNFCAKHRGKEAAVWGAYPIGTMTPFIHENHRVC